MDPRGTHRGLRRHLCPAPGEPAAGTEGHPRAPEISKELANLALLANLAQLPGKERKTRCTFVFRELLRGFSAGEPGRPVRAEAAEAAPRDVPPPGGKSEWQVSVFRAKFALPAYDSSCLLIEVYGSNYSSSKRENNPTPAG